MLPYHTGVLDGAPTGSDMILVPGGPLPPPSGTFELIKRRARRRKYRRLALTAGAAAVIVAAAGSTTFQQASVTGGSPAGGFGFVGMTTNIQGVAVAADPTAKAVWFTYDGGQTWVPSPISQVPPRSPGG
jgi:hypothetical protein